MRPAYRGGLLLRESARPRETRHDEPRRGAARLLVAGDPRSLGIGTNPSGGLSRTQTAPSRVQAAAQASLCGAQERSLRRSGLEPWGRQNTGPWLGGHSATNSRLSNQQARCFLPLPLLRRRQRRGRRARSGAEVRNRHHARDSSWRRRGERCARCGGAAEDGEHRGGVDGRDVYATAPLGIHLQQCLRGDPERRRVQCSARCGARCGARCSA